MEKPRRFCLEGHFCVLLQSRFPSLSVKLIRGNKRKAKSKVGR